MMKNALAAIALVFAVSVPALAKDVMDVADLVEKEGPAVVNISTTKMVKRGQEFDDEGMQEFFRRFFPGMPGMPGGQGGGQGPGPMQEIPGLALEQLGDAARRTSLSAAGTAPRRLDGLHPDAVGCGVDDFGCLLQHDRPYFRVAELPVSMSAMFGTSPSVVTM